MGLALVRCSLVQFPLLLTSIPPFYAGLLRAWRALAGSSSRLVVSSGSGFISVSSISCKLSYQSLLSLNHCQPHCVAKFQPVFGPLDWPCAWKSISFMPLDRLVSDLNWKLAHGVLYTADHLISFGYAIPGACFWTSLKVCRTPFLFMPIGAKWYCLSPVPAYLGCPFVAFH